jgi:ATP-dependent Lon protease
MELTEQLNLDILMAVISLIPWQDRLQMLSTPSPSARVHLATSLFTRQASIVEVSQKINTAVDESLSKQQKEFYLRQQLQAIQRELANLNRSSKKAKDGSKGARPKGDNIASGPGEGDTSKEFEEEGDEAEYFADIRAKIEAMLPGSEERKMGVKEYRRLKRIPSGSMEHGVIRSYVSKSHKL